MKDVLININNQSHTPYYCFLVYWLIYWFTEYNMTIQINRQVQKSFFFILLFFKYKKFTAIFLFYFFIIKKFILVQNPIHCHLYSFEEPGHVLV